MANSGLNELIKQKRQEVNEYKEKADKAERYMQKLMDLEQKIQNMQNIIPKPILNDEEQEIFSVLLSLKGKGDKQLQHYTICKLLFQPFYTTMKKLIGISTINFMWIFYLWIKKQESLFALLSIMD